MEQNLYRIEEGQLRGHLMRELAELQRAVAEACQRASGDSAGMLNMAAGTLTNMAQTAASAAVVAGRLSTLLTVEQF